MMKPFLYIYIILFALASVTFSPVTAAAQSFAPASEPVGAGTFHRTSAQKGVKVSTDVLALALPASALVGALVQKDWQGLLQGVER